MVNELVIYLLRFEALKLHFPITAFYQTRFRQDRGCLCTALCDVSFCLSVCVCIIISQYLQKLSTNFDEFLWREGVVQGNLLNFGGDADHAEFSSFQNFYH